jgi:signal transduction histidine kinase
MNFYLKTCLMLSFALMLFFQATAQQRSTLTGWYQAVARHQNVELVQTLLEDLQDDLLAAKEISDDSAQVFLHIKAGLLSLNLTHEHNYDTAIANVLLGLKLAEHTNFKTGIAFSYIAIAKIFSAVDKHDKAIDFLRRAQQLFPKEAKPELTMFLLNELGTTSIKKGELENAFEYFQEALAMISIVRIPSLEALVRHNMGKAFTVNSQFDKALEQYKQALAIRRRLGERYEEALLLLEAGDLFAAQNNTERAYANYKAALEVYQKIQDKRGVASAYSKIGKWYYLKGDNKQAIANLNLAISTAQAAEHREALRDSYEHLSLAHKALGDYKAALDNKERYVNVLEFIQNEERDHHVIEKQTSYLLEQKESQIDTLEEDRKERERELSEQRQKQRFLYAILALVFVVVLLVMYMYLIKRRSNRELKAINATVEAQNVQLQSLNATKDKFFSIIGHDLKGPLNSLTSFSNLLINYFDSLSKEEIQNLAKDLDKSLKNLYALLNNLLEWARSQTGNIDFTKEQFDINEVLQQNKELLSTQASTKELAILYEAGESISVSAHKQSITTVVRNLISNAIKFTPKGGAIKLEVKQSSNEVVVSVADTGVGMNQAVLDKLFRLDAKHSTLGTANEKGTGLGLILCKDFVEKNGGRVWVESEIGKGSIFYFTIPLV